MKKLLYVSIMLSGSMLMACPGKIKNDTPYIMEIVDRTSMGKSNSLCEKSEWTVGSRDVHPHFTFTLKRDHELCPKADGDLDEEVMAYEYEVIQKQCTGGLVNFKTSEFIKAAYQDPSRPQTALPVRARGKYVVTKRLLGAGGSSPKYVHQTHNYGSHDHGHHDH